MCTVPKDSDFSYCYKSKQFLRTHNSALFRNDWNSGSFINNIFIEFRNPTQLDYDFPGLMLRTWKSCLWKVMWYINVHSIIFQFTGLKLSSKDARKQIKKQIFRNYLLTKLFTQHLISQACFQRSFNFSNFREDFLVTKPLAICGMKGYSLPVGDVGRYILGWQ